MHTAILDALLNATQVGYALVDRDHRLIELGGEALSAPDGRPVGAGAHLLELLPELAGCESLLEDLRSGALPAYHLEHLHRAGSDGGTTYLTITIVPIHVPDRDQALLIIIRDSSIQGRMAQTIAQQRNELKLLRDDLARQNSRLKASNAELSGLNLARSMFITSAATELRNPLTPILGYLDLLLQDEFGPVSANQRRVIGQIHSKGQMLERLINDLIDVARFESGAMELLLQSTDLHSLVEMAVAGHRPLIEARIQRLAIHAPGLLPMALCDEARALQIISNLITTTSQQTPAGGAITITLEQAAEEGYLCVCIAGSTSERAAHTQLAEQSLGQRHAAPAATDQSGLGFTLIRSLVELHSGRLWSEQQHQREPTFCVTFPIAA